MVSRVKQLLSLSFPIANKELFVKWTDNIPKDLLPNLTKNVYICSKHFEESCYEMDGVVRKILKKDAVPTIFKNSDEHEDDTNTFVSCKKYIFSTSCVLNMFI